MSFSADDQEFINGTGSFVLPYRIRTFFDIASTRTYVLVYLYLCPMFYNSICHMAAICLLVILVFHICGELSILSYRIKNVEAYSRDALVVRIRSFVQMHLKIIWMAKSVDNAFNMVLMSELFGLSVILIISMYQVLMVRHRELFYDRNHENYERQRSNLTGFSKFLTERFTRWCRIISAARSCVTRTTRLSLYFSSGIPLEKVSRMRFSEPGHLGTGDLLYIHIFLRNFDRYALRVLLDRRATDSTGR
ncbi:uncharacterized protein LOC105182243 isoform X4 [Harpegnathos saltator]|uniref:uncharacterized protein LOC105182243 isoform X4 n=1 Tax=Harpegnathos saltator TaxID=610380 RepID=UPI000DBED55A|nr:uncharacterized protein LOC105182243 isoform X4 [Harpegnathos saltator]